MSLKKTLRSRQAPGSARQNMSLCFLSSLLIEKLETHGGMLGMTSSSLLTQEMRQKLCQPEKYDARSLSVRERVANL